MGSRSAARAGEVSGTEERAVTNAAVRCACPACGAVAREEVVERYGRFELHGCDACGLQFWEPREMPDARWYEQMYGGRDQNILPLEPGHKYFLADELAPRGGDLLDIGCGTGNFLAAAREAGYRVTGTELDRNAAQFAKERLGLARVLPLTVAEFAERFANETFDVVTFFEVLEHQTHPVEFLRSVQRCLRPRGVIAVSVPNRERWLTGPDVLDYPPNHFLRWNAAALRRFLGAQGFEVLSVREEPASLNHTALMIDMALRTGMTQNGDSGAQASFRDVMQMTPEQAEAALRARPPVRTRILRALGLIKRAACYPLAVAALPYVRWRGLKGTYLYCLARLRD
ncbi:MAG TPA: class I SAM-dependent methyltransferase [Methylomirabilota bacterium]|nr:class I SAM-dependent methyltransferase [Methylomirabilota bacterium]